MLKGDKMNQSQYEKIKTEYERLKRRKSDFTGNSGGCHYLVAYALMAAGIDVRGLDNLSLEGEAERVLSLYGKQYD